MAAHTIPESMHAITFDAFGNADVLKYTKVPTPKLADGDDSVIVKLEAIGVNPVDYKIREGYLAMVLGSKFPMIVGADYAGTVVAVGSGAVGGIKVGDAVYGKTDVTGTYVQYLKVSTKKHAVYKRPHHIQPVAAAGVGVAALTAFTGLVNNAGLAFSKGGHAGKKILVIGASGGVGSWTVLLSKYLGLHVTAVCSGKNKELVQKFGADRVVDYTVKPLAEQLTVENEFDVVYDSVGGVGAWELSQKVLKPSGFYVTPAGDNKGPINLTAIAGTIGGSVWKGLTSSRKYRFIMSLPIGDFKHLAKLLEDKAIDISVIPLHTFALQDAKKAHELSESQRTAGKIILLP